MTRAVIVTDVQNDFCEGGSLAVAGGAEVAAAISRHLARPDDALVVATRDMHEDPGPHFSATPDYVDSWPPHCVVGTPGADFHPNLDTGRVQAVFEKGRHQAAYSGFEGTDADGVPLERWLRDRGVTEVEIVGIATDHCVRATTLDARKAGFATTVRLDLTAGVAKSTTDRALAQLREAGAVLVGEPVVRS